MSLKHELDLYLAEQEDRKTRMGATQLPLLPSQIMSGMGSAPPAMQENQPDSLYSSLGAQYLRAQDEIRLQEEETLKQQKNALFDAVGSGLWSLADEASFGLLGSAVHHGFGEEGKEFVEYMRPQTVLGQISAGIGGTVGFMAGAPLKFGAKAAKVAATPFIKGAGAQTGASIIKTSSKEAAEKITSESGQQFAKDFKKKVGSIFEQPKTLKSIKADKEFVEHAHRNIDEILDNGIAAGRIGKREANALRKAYKNNITSRPLNDFVDLLTRNSTGRGMRALGYAVHEATMFGIIDGVHEAIHHYGHETEEYDWSRMFWGMGIGASFGGLKYFNIGGKASNTMQDFQQGLKAFVGYGAKKSIDNAKPSNVKKMAEILGKDLKRVGENESKVTVSYKGKEIEVDLGVVDDAGRNVSIQGASIKGYGTRRKVSQAVENHILKLAMHKKRVELGPQLMNWAMKSEFEQMKQTWPLMVAGTILMNARTWVDMAQGNPIDSTDVIFNLFLGAFLNRKGLPKEYDVGGQRMKSQMNHLRAQLNIMGVSTKNLHTLAPTLDGTGRDPIINPLNGDPALKEISKEMDKLGMGGDSIQELSTDSRRQSVQYMETFAGENFTLFNEFKRYYFATSKHKYVATNDMIAASDARAIQNKIRSLNKGKIVPNKTITAVVRAISREKQVIDKEAKKLGFEDVHQLVQVVESGKQVPEQAQKLYERYSTEYTKKVGELTGKEAGDLTAAEFSLYKILKQMPENGVEIYRYDLTNKTDVKNSLDLLEASRIRGEVENADFIKKRLDAEMKTIKDNKMLDAKEIKALESQIKAANKAKEELAYKQIGGVKDVAELRNLLEERTVEMYESVKGLVFNVQSEIMKIIGYTPGDKSTNNIGTIPENIVLNADLELSRLAKDGKLDWLTKNGVVLKGADAQHEITTLQVALGKINKAAELFYQGKVDGTQHQVTDINQVKELYKLIKSNEMNVDGQFNVSRNDFKFNFSDMDHIIGQIVTRELYTDTKKTMKLFDPSNPDFLILNKALLESKILEYDPLAPGGNTILQDISRLKIVGADGKPIEDSGIRSFVNSVQKLVRAFNQSDWSVQTNTKPIEVSLESVEQLRIAFNNLGYGNKTGNTKFFEHWANEISYRAVQIKLKDSNINNQDVSLLEKITFMPAGTSQSEQFTLGKYAKGKGDAPGWTVYKIKSLFTDEVSNSIVQKYNDMVEGISRKSKGVVTLQKDVVTIIDRNTISALNNLMVEAKMMAGKSSKEHLALFLQTAKQSKLTDVLNTLSAHDGETSTKVMEWLVADGIVKPLVFNGEIQYIPNKRKFASENYQLSLLERLNRYNTKFGTISDVIESARKVAEDSNNASLELNTDRSLTANSFVTKYLNHDKGFQSKNAEDLTTFIRDIVYENVDGVYTFRGEKAIKDLMGRMKFKPEEVNQAFDDAIKVITGSVSGIEKAVIRYDRGSLRIDPTGRKINVSPFTKFMDEVGVDWLYVESRAKEYQQFGERYFINEQLDPFQANSDKLNLLTISHLKKLNTSFNDLLYNYTEAVVTGPSRVLLVDGITPFRFGNSGQAIGLSNSSHKKITENFVKFKEKYYDKFNPTYQNRLNKLEQRLLSANGMGNEHVAAFRLLLAARMLKGKNVDKIVEYAQSPDGSSRFADLYRRFGLMASPSAKRVNRDVVTAVRDYVKNNKDLHPHIKPEVFDRYLKRKNGEELNIVTWADKLPGAGDLKQDSYLTKQLAKFGVTWDELLSGRATESGYDSIVYIPSQYRDYLNAISGASVNAPNSVKPVISSMGENLHFFGKTMFVWSPEVQKNVFNKNPELDMLITQTADKLNSTPPEKLLQMSREDLLTGPDLTTYHQKLALDAVGVIKVTDVGKPGAISPSMFNFTSNSVNGKVFEGLYSTDVQGAITRISEAFSNPFVAKEILKIATGQRDLDMQAMSGSSMDHQNVMLNILNKYDHAIPDMFGDALIMNVLKKKFIDPVIKPVSEYRHGSETIRWGNQTPLIQDLNRSSYDLAPTINKGGEILQYGQVMLPNSAREARIEYPGKDLQLYIIGEGGPNKKPIVQNAKKWYFEYYKNQKIDKETIQESWDFIKSSAEPMGLFHDILLRETNGQFQLATASVRYPRTRPNDLMFLRVKDFLAKEYGEASIVNKFDVLNVMEGDYDSDVANFFYASNPSMRRHIQRASEKWVHTVDESILRPEMPPVSLIPENISVNESNWNQYDSNRRVVDNIGKGVVQRNLKLVNFVRDVSRKVDVKDEQGRVIGTEYVLYDKTIGNTRHKLVVDWDMNNWHERTALEGQHLLDYVKGVDPSIFKGADSYRWDYLFPERADSFSRSDFMNPTTGNFDPTLVRNRRNEMLRSEKGSPTKKIRVFRHLEWDATKEMWIERDLHTVDKEAIKMLMRKHNRFLSISQEVNISGRRKTPNYQEMIDMSKDYFDFFNEGVINDNIYKAVKYSKRQDPDGSYKPIFTGYGADAMSHELTTHFGSKEKVTADYKRRLRYAQNQRKKGKDVPLPEQTVLDTYTWYEKPFFDSEVMSNLQNIGRGEFGTPLERSMYQFYRTNPLQASVGSEKLRGDMYTRFLKLEQDLHGIEYTGETYSMERINALVPKLSTDLKIATSQIKKLNYIMYSVANNKRIRVAQKNATLENLKQKRTEYERKIWDLLPAEYKKNRSNKNLPNLKMVHIGGEREQLRAMTQFYMTEWFINNIHLRGHHKKMLDDVRAAKQEWGKEWGEYFQNTSTEKYGENTILNEILKEQRFNQLEPKEIHANTEGRLLQLYNEYGPLALWHYAAPKKMTSASTEMTLGIFQGNVVNMAAEPSKTFSQVMKFLGKVANKQIEQVRDVELAAQEANSILEMATKMYTTTHQYFHKNVNQIAKDDIELFNRIGKFAPDMPYFLNNAFKKYTDLRFSKVSNEYNPFSFGIRENGQMDFMRRLFNMSGDNNAFREYTEGLSRLNQMSIENQYMHPMKYAAIMHSIEGKANEIMKNAFPGVMDINTGNVMPISRANMADNPLYVLLGGGNATNYGYKLNTLSNFTNYQKDMMKRLFDQTNQTLNAKSDTWNEMFKENSINGYNKSNNKTGGC